MSLAQQKLTKDTILDQLQIMGFHPKRINRAIKLYEKRYPIYNLHVVKEIVYRLAVKDRLKKLQKSPEHNVYRSRVNVQMALESMSFHDHYIDLALSEYEVYSL